MEYAQETVPSYPCRLRSQPGRMPESGNVYMKKGTAGKRREKMLFETESMKASSSNEDMM